MCACRGVPLQAMRALIQDMLQVSPANRPDIFQVRRVRGRQPWA